MAHSRRLDLLGLQENVHRRVRNLEIGAPTTREQVESFIMDPAIVRAWPAAIAVPSVIYGVQLYLTSGGPVTVKYWAVDSGTPTLLHTFTGAVAGTVHRVVGYLDYGDEFDLGLGDVYYPEITAGTGGPITAGFIVR